MTLVLVCECGVRLRAPNAVAGRIGRCPSCLARLRVPDPLPEGIAGQEVEVLAAIREPTAGIEAVPDMRLPDMPEPREPWGYGLGLEGDLNSAEPTETLPDRAPIGMPPADHLTSLTTSAKGRRKRSAEHGSRGADEGRPGRVLPRSGKSTWRFCDSLLYPLRDGPAIAILASLCPICVVLSIFSFGLRDYVTSGEEVMTMGALTMVFPALCLLAIVFGYGGLFLSEVLTSSAHGEHRHPKLPAWEFYEILTSLGRWSVACSYGIALGLGLAWVYATMSAAMTTPPPRPIDALAMSALFGFGAVLWPIPVVAVMLSSDIRAANPITVLRAVTSTLIASTWIGLLFGIVGSVTLALAELLFSLPRFGLPATMIGIGLFWVLFWYEAIVLVRLLGMQYQNWANMLEWFPERPR